MSTSKVKALAAQGRTKSSRKVIFQNLLGGVAVAWLVVGCGWPVYSNIIAASVYPTLESARYDEPVIKPRVRLATRSATEAVNEVFAALPEAAPVISKPMTVAAITPTMFNERFAASAAQGVASNAANAPPPREAPKLAEASMPLVAPKIAQAPKSQESSPHAPVKVAALPASPPPAETKPPKAPATSIRDMAQRAKAPVMSPASTHNHSISDN